jgi:hypothetical protein
MKHKAELGAAICAAGFIVVLVVAAYWEPAIRLLHIFESLPYLTAGILCLRHHKFGYALGVVSGAFWLWTGGLLTNFVRNGFERLAMLVRTGSVDRLDILIAVPAALATGGLVLFSLAGYMRHARKSGKDILLWLAALVIVPSFFIGIFAEFAPQYLGMFERIFKR